MRYVILLLVFISCNRDNDAVYPEVRTITESVYSSVTIQPDSLYQLFAAVGGILDHNYVEEGDLVQKGDSLIQIINNTPKLNAENATLALKLARENYEGRAAVLDELQDEIRAARLKYLNDSINYFRQKNLWSRQIGSKIELDTRKLAYDLSSNSLELLYGKYERIKLELETNLKQAENNLKTARIANKDFTVTSKINGKVYALFKNSGEKVSVQEPLGTVGNADTFIIEMLIDEVDIVSITIGQRVLVDLDAYKNKVFEANVTKIYPQKDERSQTFTVEARFADPPEVLYPGLSGEANILIAVKQDVLTIPKNYLLSGDRVNTKNGFIEVKTGLQDLEYVEILEGIDRSTPLLKPE
ncbi:efflux RND transporter periplasmic adaptor subunit [Robertkochia solimangrovi]|uniref:efflux RND transporter periplasmic adaptor subunit n=1 Tax=Robertkochia solimangrovi TaxID=2213046 RepID=UPI0011802B1C|nr:efflux RND transporter periplasmic adaptor subunit [Robertkochia solimangrovi]TRZ40989.1 efflux transporter periplasmic adaptor subunit [Robertkochia solimangrovi]